MNQQQPRWRQILEQARTDADRQDAEDEAAINAAWGCHATARQDADINRKSAPKD